MHFGTGIEIVSIGIEMKQIAMILLLVTGLASAGVYRDAGAGLYPFLKMDTGARSASLGGTDAVNGDLLSIFANPAMIAGSSPGVSAGHNQWYGTTTQNFLAGTAVLSDRFTGSLGFRAVSTTGLEYREAPTSDPVDVFDAYDFSAVGAVAARTGRFDAGIGFKYIHEKIWLESSNGWAVDLGVAYHPAASLVLTAAYLHSGPMVVMDEDEFRMPRTWLFASRWNVSLPQGTASLSGQVERPLDNQAVAGFGIEYRPVQWAAVRGGWKTGDDSSDLTAGAGLSASDWMLAYAFVPGDYALGDSHRVTLSRAL